MSLLLTNAGAPLSASIGPDVLAYISVLPAEPTPGFVSVIQDTVRSLKAINNNFAEIDRLFLSAVDYRPNAYYSLVNPSTTPSSEIANMLWNQYGFKGASDSYVRTFYTPSVDGVKYQEASACFFYWSLTDLNDSNSCDGGCQPSVIGGNKSLMSFARGSNNWYSSINDDSNSNIDVSGVTSSIGFYSLVRNGQSVSMYKNGVLLHTETFDRTGLPELEVWMFGLNQNGSLGYQSSRQIPCYGFGSGDIDQVELYNSMSIYVSGMAALYPSPPAPSEIPLNNPKLKLQIPSLIDNSGNGFDSVLGASLPGGFSAPVIDIDNNLVFSGLETVKLNSSFTLTKLNIHTQFFIIYTDTPETTQSLLNVDLAYVCGTRIATYTRDNNKWVVLGGVYYDEGAATEPVWGRSLPKLQKGYNVLGFSFSATRTIMYCNGLISYFSPNCSYTASGNSGWLGGFPGGTTANMYTLPASYKLPNNSFVEVFDYAADRDQMQDKGNLIMFENGLSQILFEGDSLTQGFTLSNNADNWPDWVITDLLSNTSQKWASCNIGIGGRYLRDMATQDPLDDQSVTFNWTASVSINKIVPTIGDNIRNVFVLLAGINDIANGRTLQNLKDDFTAAINYRAGQGYQCFALTPTGDMGLSSGEQVIWADYLTYLRTNPDVLPYVLIDTCSNVNLASNPSGANSYFSDGVHYTALTCTTIIGPMVSASIQANLP